MTDPSASSRDVLRQTLVVLGAVGAPLTSYIAALTGTGRTISEQSELSDTLLVPAGTAFAIWGPIFLGLVAYAVIQGLPRNRARAAYRRTGWWAAASLWLICAWSFAAAFPPVALSRWLTALIFVPAMLAACFAAWRFAEERAALSVWERALSAGSVSLLAGWCSLAVFLNWAQLGVVGPLGFGLSETVVCLLTLALALAWIAFALHRARGSLAYVFPPLWGLGFLALARLSGDEPSAVIAYAALGGIGVLVVSTLIARRRRV